MEREVLLDSIRRFSIPRVFTSFVFVDDKFLWSSMVGSIQLFFARMKNLNISGLELREDGGSCTLLLKVVPRSAQNKIVGVENGLLKLRIQAPPAEGAANDVVIRFLSDCLGRARTTIEMDNVSARTNGNRMAPVIESSQFDE